LVLILLLFQKISNDDDNKPVYCLDYGESVIMI